MVRYVFQYVLSVPDFSDVKSFGIWYIAYDVMIQKMELKVWIVWSFLLWMWIYRLREGLRPHIVNPVICVDKQSGTKYVTAFPHLWIYKPKYCPTKAHKKRSKVTVIPFDFVTGNFLQWGGDYVSCLIKS